MRSSRFHEGIERLVRQQGRGVTFLDLNDLLHIAARVVGEVAVRDVGLIDAVPRQR